MKISTVQVLYGDDGEISGYLVGYDITLKDGSYSTGQFKVGPEFLDLEQAKMVLMMKITEAMDSL